MHQNPTEPYDPDFFSAEDLAIEPGPSRSAKPGPRRRRLVGWLLGGALGLGLIGLALLWHFQPHGQVSAKPPAPEPPANRKELAKNIFLEVQGETRRVIVKAAVCLREGQLEGLMCRKQTKEHEYILSADLDATKLHAALLATGARTGSPVKFEPRYTPATGTVIKITLQYEKDGKRMRVPAQQWIRSGRKGDKVLEQDWVFAGSLFIQPDDKDQPPIYLANHGDVVCVCNMESAMLDLPVRSPKSFDNRIFTANTDRIPPLETPVEVIFEPVLEKK
jgi:hypothetical protein